MATMLMPGRTFITNNVNTQKSFENGCTDTTIFAVLKTYRMARLEDFRSNTQLCLLVESCFILSSGFRITGKTTNIPKIRIYKIDDYAILLWVPAKQATEQQDLKHLSNLNQATRQVFHTHHIAGNIK